jgi:uncharacterized DUF497 family protein
VLQQRSWAESRPSIAGGKCYCESTSGPLKDCELNFYPASAAAAVEAPVWTWDPTKAASNKLKHLVSFELAEIALADPLGLSEPDPCEFEERWRTLGSVGGVIIFVVHTLADDADDSGLRGRIISARKATPRERRIYQNG